MKRSPIEVIPEPLASSVADTHYWFVIGGQAVRCFVPYRPSHDVDFGVLKAKDERSLIEALKRRGSVQLLESSKDTVHLNFEGIDVSIFVLPHLAAHVDAGSLTVDGILATKTHAILDRGTRRDFFDLYVMLQSHGLGVVDCIDALNRVYDADVNQGLILRALSYFEDAEADAPLPGEGREDWARVQAFFSRAAAALVVPPTRSLEIQGREVDVRSGVGSTHRSTNTRKRKTKPRA